MQNKLLKTKLIQLLTTSTEPGINHDEVEKAYELFTNQLYNFMTNSTDQRMTHFQLHHTRIELQSLQIIISSKVEKKYNRLRTLQNNCSY